MSIGNSERRLNGTKKISILMIIGSLVDGGKERQLLLLLKTLKKHKQIHTSLMVMNSGGERENEAAKLADELVVLPDRRNLDIIMPLKRIIQLIKQKDIDMLNTWGSGIWDLIGLLAGRICHIPVINNGIRSAPIHLNFDNRLTWFSARFSDSVVANSAAGLKAFQLNNNPDSKVIYNGLDTSRFQDIQLVNTGQNLCMVANFREAKDHKSLILAMPQILKRFPNTSLYLVGHDYGTLSFSKVLVNELSINDKVNFITECSAPEPIIGKCQIGILTTNEAVHGEGISNAILEYMALSKPVIASINGGNSEIIIENKTGFLVEPGSSKQISEKVIYLFENPGEANKMGEQGKVFVNEQFSLARMENEYIDMYQKFI